MPTPGGYAGGGGGATGAGRGVVVVATSLRESAHGRLTFMAITGVHSILYTDDAVADRAFLADVLGLTSVDAGDGWLIFALPPAELDAHPAAADGGGYELYLMCDNIEATVRELAAKGVEFSSGVTQQRWGLVTTIRLPGGGRLGLYEPLHATPLDEGYRAS